MCTRYVSFLLCLSGFGFGSFNRCDEVRKVFQLRQIGPNQLLPLSPRPGRCDSDGELLGMFLFDPLPYFLHVTIKHQTARRLFKINRTISFHTYGEPKTNPAAHCDGEECVRSCEQNITRAESLVTAL